VTTEQFTLPSHAKINWSLQILGRRPDGFHELRTILQTISLHDELSFTLGEGEIVVSCDNPEVPTAEGNLIVRAANALKSLHRLKSGARIHLKKNIPIKAGLGGASANAAVTLIGLTRLWQIQTDLPDLIEIAATLGSDVPFFMVGGCALGTGTGASLAPLKDLRQQWILIVKPHTSVSTADAYKALRATALTTNEPIPILSISCLQADFADFDQWTPLHEKLRNDFEAVIFDIAPETERAKNALLQAGARGALLAGSGSSVFGIFENQEAQQRALREIQAEAGWRIIPSVTLTREQYARAVGLF